MSANASHSFTVGMSGSRAPRPPSPETFHPIGEGEFRVVPGMRTGTAAAELLTYTLAGLGVPAGHHENLETASVDVGGLVASWPDRY